MPIRSESPQKEYTIRVRVRSIDYLANDEPLVDPEKIRLNKTYENRATKGYTDSVMLKPIAFQL